MHAVFYLQVAILSQKMETHVCIAGVNETAFTACRTMRMYESMHEYAMVQAIEHEYSR